MSTRQLSGLTLEDLLPHRDNMLLIGKVLTVDRNKARTASRVSRSWPMGDKDGVYPLILVELAAQTAGVCNGWDRIQTLGLDSNQMGWLVGIKKADIDVDVLPYDTEVVVAAENTCVFDNLRETACAAYIEDQCVASITLQLFQP